MKTFIENKLRADFDIVCSRFEDDHAAFINNKELPIITIYDHPRDYPDKYVARLFLIRAEGPQTTRYIMIDDDLQNLRDRLPNYLQWLDRRPEDDSTIIEVWI